ncbi:glycoside hydrolase family 25 protein [Sphingobacteriaceae bacterium WQ 2009]|uniref:Glycoside hydrolase family 25 protein n=1 Tax=Rhinopithecimicrobium faecis TaxID=2820698 RepID=A0A8T4HBR0_9SPHI|nr:glycoside hydrolase family 25 protein [Sphingobacteriaceae bacterium WQ 2009]
MKQPAKKSFSPTKKATLPKSLPATTSTTKWIVIAVAALFVLSIGVFWHYRAGILYYLRSAQNPNSVLHKDNRKYDIRNVEIMSSHAGQIFGIDISQYQGDIRWNEVNTINDQFPIDFIFIRATMGEKSVDKKYKVNWRKAASRAKLRGAYHYYRPNENSIQQANNFVKVVQLKPGDLPPVLDIEDRPRDRDMEKLRLGLKRWLQLVENHYGIKPIIYSGDSYYKDFLEKEFSDYTIWIANYNFFVEEIHDTWNFWQFSERGTVRGIDEYVDLNIFNGDIEALEKLAIPYK